MKSVANDYINKQECSIQECLPCFARSVVKKIISRLIFANSNVTEKRFRVCIGEDEIFESPEEYKTIYK